MVISRRTYVLLGTSAAFSIAYASRIYYSTKDIPWHAITRRDSIQVGKSVTTDLVNPLNGPLLTERYTLQFRLRQPVANDELLLCFTRGFFHNPVFAPESLILSTLRRDFTRFVEPRRYVWNVPSMDDIPPVGTSILGAFQVLDSTSTDASASIDLGYGKAASNLSGAHQLSVAQSDGQVVLQFQCIVCDKNLNRWMMKFHQLYSFWLFRSAASIVKRTYG